MDVDQIRDALAECYDRLADIAREIGCSPSVLSKFLNLRATPKRETLGLLARYLNLDTDSEAA